MAWPVRAVRPGLPRRSASKRPWLGADNGLYVAFARATGTRCRLVATAALSVIGGIAATALLLGCQGRAPVMPLEEARKVTASFTATALVPPPRTISDVMTILEREAAAAQGLADARRAAADRLPQVTTDSDTLARFYYRRALAARDLGRAQQELADIRQAAELARRTWKGRQDQMEILWRVAHAEAAAGNFSRAIAATRDAISVVPQNLRGWHIRLNSHLAVLHAAVGDLSAAESAAAEVERMLSESYRWVNVPRLHQAINEYDIAVAQAAIQETRGNLPQAEVLYRRSITALRSFSPSLPPNEALDVRASVGKLSSVIARQGRLLEAEAWARSALIEALQTNGRYTIDTGSALRSLTRVVLEQGRFAEAERLARASIDIFEKSGAAPDSLPLAFARDDLGAALVAQRKWPEAVEQYAPTQVAMALTPGLFDQIFGGNLNLAMALLHAGRSQEALRHFDAALGRTERALGSANRSTAETRGLRAAALSSIGERREALKEFSRAAEILFDRAFEGDDEQEVKPARDQRLAVIIAAHMGLLADVRGTALEALVGDATAESFRLAQLGHDRRVQRSLDASAARNVAKGTGLAALVRDEQDAGKRLGAFSGVLVNLLSVPSTQRDQDLVANLRAQIDTLRAARQSLLRTIEREFPEYGQLVNPSPLTVGQVQTVLRPGEALVATFVTEDRTYVWAVPNNGPPVFATAPIGEKALEERVSQLRRSLDPRARRLGEIPAFDLETAHDLYRTLLEPVRRGWQGTETLLVVAHGPLGLVPFALLPTERGTLGEERGPLFANYRNVSWLVRRYAVTTLPSVGALVTLRRLPAGAADRRLFVGFGDPYFSAEQAREAAREGVAARTASAAAAGDIAGRALTIALRDVFVTPAATVETSKLSMLPRLRDTAEEIRSIAAALSADPARDVFLGRIANETTVKTLDLARYRVIAFATHGLVPGDLDGLTQPALALTAPEVAEIDGDGLLTMEEVLTLRLDADWVVLSACNTANGARTGAEALSGLGRAFFYAGARALLVTHWPVETTSARILTTDLFRRQRQDPTLDRARALQQTMTWLIDSGEFVDPSTGKVVFSYAHPIFWAPFILVGDGG